MTSHIHLIIRAGGEILLQDILRDYKKFTSKAIIQAINENIQESRKECLPAGKGRVAAAIQYIRRFSVLERR